MTGVQTCALPISVGYPETLLTAASLVRPGGTIANIGVHGAPVELPMQEMWIQNAASNSALKVVITPA